MEACEKPDVTRRTLITAHYHKRWSVFAFFRPRAGGAVKAKRLAYMYERHHRKHSGGSGVGLNKNTHTMRKCTGVGDVLGNFYFANGKGGNLSCGFALLLWSTPLEGMEVTTLDKSWQSMGKRK